ncbi:hypothetical protein QR680_008152 [Steinernema hermaphroditum]|uniref:C-type lectin domain-containing protein n=1 Tax=Steinernema hermaphroditum TaxID=289476 RepID=A0AA39IFL2_9BILA|nr:hypothetical protein QR680_008152 [Steinernema hermaphroditum]
MLTIDVVNLAPELEDYINKKAARNPLQVRNELGRGPWISKRALIDVTWYVMAPRLRNPAGWISAFAEEIREWAANNHSLPKRRTRQKDQDTQQYVEHLEQTIKRMCSISNELKVDIADARQEITNSNSIDDIKWNELIEEADKVLMESRDLINDLEDEVYNVRTSPKSDVKGSNKLSNQKLEEEKRYEEFCEQKCTFHLSPDKGRDALTLLAAKQREFALHGTSAPSPLLMTHSSTAPSAPVKYIAPLPPINLRKFDGDPRKWNEFETTFHTTLDQNPHIGVAVKFAYLMGYLEGEARELLLHVTNALRLRYSLIPHELIAKDRDSKGVVAGKHACALKAFQEDKIAFDIENGQTCVLLDDFEGFKEKTGKRKAYLLGSSTHNDEGCDSTSNFDVGKIASKDCDMNEKLCEKMRELHTICQKIDDPDCIMKCPVESRGKYSNGTSFCCPDGKIFGETDGLPTCCPRGQTFQKKEDDRDMCRPKDTELKGVFDGKPVCCPSSMAHISGTSQCCPGSCTYKESFQRCLGVVNLSPLPTTQKELNQFCRDEGAEPVKIQNAAQNQDVASMATNPMIGLQIPEGVAWTKDNFRWTDGSVPSYTNFNLFEPNNAERGKGPEVAEHLLVHATDALRLRYSLTPHELIARKRDVKGVVAGKLQCALTAFQEDKIAFLIEDGQICVLLDGLKGFQEKSGPNRETYLLDTNTQNDRCGDPPKFDVAQLLSQSDDCGKHKTLCEKMKELHDYCKNEADNRSCIISSCPEGQKKVIGSKKCCYAIKQKDGKEVCCPKNTFPGKGENGDELCCPQKGTCCPGGTVVSGTHEGRVTCCPKGQTFQKVLNGKDLCCPSGQVVLSGSSSCCWAINDKGRDFCCPKNTFPGKYGGKEVCCPEKDTCCAPGYEVGGADGNKAVCCPKGKMFVKKVDKTEICCPRGTEYKGMHEDNPVCCPSDMEWTSGSSVCCPPGFTYRKEFGKCLKYVAIDKSRQLHGIKEMNDYCKKLKADPVKIENAAQNQVVASMDSEAVIGLQIPEGEAWNKDGFRWVSDGSKPSYTNFIPGEPNNLIGILAPAQGPEYFVRLNGLGQWLDVNGTPAWLGLRGSLVCMAAYESA